MAENEMIKDTAPLPEEQPEAVSEEILAEHPDIPAENPDMTAGEDAAEEDSEDIPKISVRDIFAALGEFLGKFSWVFLLVISVCLVSYYILFPSRNVFHSDTTDTLMWAVASNESGTLFNPDFNYACLLPFSTSLIMTALIPIFGVSMTTHVLGMLIFFLIMTGGLVWMCRKMKWSWGWTSVMVFTVLMMLSSSEKLREIFWGHTIYYSLGVMFIFIGLSLVFHYMDLGAKKDAVKNFDPHDKTDYKLILVTVLIGLWFILTCTNQLIAMVIFAIPVIAAVFCERVLDTGSKLLCKKNRRSLVLLLIMAVCMVVGYLLTNVLADGIVAGYESAFSSYSPMNEWLTNLMKFPEHWITLLGVNVVANEPLLSARSIMALIRLIGAVIILVLPLVALCNYNKIEDAKLRILILTYWFMTALILLGYTCGKLSNANWRLSPIAAMSVVVSVAFLHWAVSHVSVQRIASVLMIPVFLACLFNGATIAKMPKNQYQNAVLYQLADVLMENDLDYGYATFWRANCITVISDSEVECRSVNVNEHGVTPYNYQSCYSWFDDQPNQDRYFLLMTDIEKQNLEATTSPLLEMEHEEIFAHGYYIWVFNENIFEKTEE